MLHSGDRPLGLGGTTRRARDAWIAGRTVRLFGPLALGWVALVALVAALESWSAVAVSGIWAANSGNLVTPERERDGILFNLVAMALAIILSIAIGLAMPRWWRSAMGLAALLPVPFLLWTSGNLHAGLALAALLVPTVWLGRRLAARVFVESSPFETWVLGATCAIGLIAAYGLVLGVAGLLRPWAVWPVLGVVFVATLASGHRQAAAEFAACLAWLTRPVSRRPARLFLAGIGLAYFWIALIGALTPETFSDAVRQRTPTALAFATTGRLATPHPELSLPLGSPVAGEIIYAVSLTLGPVQIAKLLNFVVSLWCVGAAYAVGRRFGGKWAGIIAAFGFATMPLAVWLAQTAYLDLFLTLLALAAVLAMLIPRRPDARVAIATGLCIGLGIAVKIHFGEVAIGLVTAFGLLTLWRGGLRRVVGLGALLAVVAVCTAAPWLARTYFDSGYIPGLTLFRLSLPPSTESRSSVHQVLGQYGYSRSWASAALAPFAMTFQSGRYGELSSPAGPFGGQFGYLALAFVPLLAAARSRRPTLLVLTGVLASFGVWFYVAQYARYALPLLALLCTVAGAAFASARARLAAPRARRALTLLLLILACCGVAVQLRVPSVGRDYAFGREDRATFLTKYLFCCSGYAALQALDAEPTVTRVFAPRDPARLYSGARMSSLWTVGDVGALGADEATALGWLRDGGYSHILIDRRQLPTNWEQLIVFDEAFLRRHTVLVGGGNNTYLYRLVPSREGETVPSWASGTELLPNASFMLASDGTLQGWQTRGTPRPDGAGGESLAESPAILITPRDEVAAGVAVVAKEHYLLVGTLRGAGDADRVRLQISWQGAGGGTIATTFDEMAVTAHSYRTVTTRAIAPTGATAATIAVRAADGAVWLDEVSLRVATPVHLHPHGSEWWQATQPMPGP